MSDIASVPPQTTTEIDMSISGQFSRAGVDDEVPNDGINYTKITEGFAAVLFPPAKHVNGKGDDNAKNVAKGIVSGKKDENNNHSGGGGEGKKVGDATNFFVNNEFGGNEDDQAVFYNPAQVVNRDLTICVMETFSRQRRTEPLRKGGVGDRGITIVEALSASGLRSVRYWKEITGLKYIVANDLDPDAVECMKRNLAYNKIPIGHATLLGNTPSETWRGVVPNEDDAVVLMQRLGLEPCGNLRTVGFKVNPPKNVSLGERPTLLSSSSSDTTTAATAGTSSSSSSQPAQQQQQQPELVPLLQCDKMDIVDLDPYGSASPFLESAMQCCKEGGLMCITSTDSAILCGTYPETAHAKYNSITIRHTACHEMAVRTLLAAVERTANKHKKFIVPLLSLHIDFYVRIFIRVYTQQAEVKLAACKLAHYFKCTRCPNFAVVPLGRVKVHGKNNNNNDTNEGGADEGANNNGANGNNVNKKAFRKERRADKREREELEASIAVAAGAGAGTEATTTAAASEAAAATVVGASGAIAAGEHFDNPEFTKTVPASARNINAPPAFHDFTRQAPNIFPPNHNRSVPFSVNPSTIRNVSYECCVCKGAMAITGPIYAAPTHDKAFLESLEAVITERHNEQRLTATNRIRGLVAAAKDELPHAPMFVEVPEIASLVRLPTPPLPEFVGAVSRLGYQCSQVHCNHAGLKTDAPVDVLVGLMLDYQRRFCQQSHVAMAENNSASVDDSSLSPEEAEKARKKKEEREKEAPAGRKIYVPAITGDFSYSKEYDFKRMAQSTGNVKFVQNAPGWGPKARHRGVARDDNNADAAAE